MGFAYIIMSNEIPKEAKVLIGFLTLIIGTTTENSTHTLTQTNIRCFEKGCEGLIKTVFRPDTEEIPWFCPDCENEGLIICCKEIEWDNR